MKRCRTCNRKYTDETYEYCLDDGTPLSGAFDVDATLVLDQSLRGSQILAGTECEYVRQRVVT